MPASPPAQEPLEECAQDLRHGRVLLLAGLLLGLLRFHALGEWSLWHDEALTYADAYGRATFDNPLGYWIWSQWLALHPDPPSEWVLRAPAALFGWLCLPLAYWAFRPLVGVRLAGALALCLAVSPWHLAWSQTARFYTLAQALSLLGAGCFTRGLLHGRRAALGAGLCAVLISGTAHPSGWLLAPALIAASFLARVRAPWLPGAAGPARWVLLVALAVGLCCAPAGIEMLERWRRLRGAGTPGHFLLTSGFYLSPWVLTAALWGSFEAWQSRNPRLVFALAVAVLGGATALAIALRVRVSAQYVFVFQPWVLLLALLPLCWRPQAPRAAREERLAWLALALLVLPALISSLLYLTVRRAERPAWREAYAYVAERLQADDLILGMEAPVGEFYLNPGYKNLRLPQRVVWLDEWRASLPSLWSRYERRMWLIINQEQFEDWDQPDEVALLREFLATRCRLVHSWPLEVESRDLSVLVYCTDP